MLPHVGMIEPAGDIDVGSNHITQKLFGLQS